MSSVRPIVQSHHKNIRPRALRFLERNRHARAGSIIQHFVSSWHQYRPAIQCICGSRISCRAHYLRRRQLSKEIAPTLPRGSPNLRSHLSYLISELKTLGIPLRSSDTAASLATALNRNMSARSYIEQFKAILAGGIPVLELLDSKKSKTNTNKPRKRKRPCILTLVGTGNLAIRLCIQFPFHIPMFCLK